MGNLICHFCILWNAVRAIGQPYLRMGPVTGVQMPWAPLMFMHSDFIRLLIA